MAHGYITSNGTMEVEDIGNEILNELVLRCLLQRVRTNMGEVYFKMHDLVHDLAQSIMENKVLGAQVGINNRSAPNTKVRQVNLKNRSVAFPTSIIPNMDLTSALTSYSRLRVLNARETNIDDLPSKVGKLKHLRCLDLSSTNIRSLPNAMCSLWNLKILNLNFCNNLVGLPKNMRYMRNLRHLLLLECSSLSEMPPSIGELASLKTLSLFIVGHERGNQLKELEFLNLGGILVIEHLERVKNVVDAKKANLAKKQNLCDLSLLWEVDDNNACNKSGGEDVDEKVFEALQPHSNLKSLLVRGFKGNNFPLWMRNSTLENVVQIFIEKCPNCLHLPQVLGELPRLKHLWLCDLAVQYVLENDEIGGVNTVLTPKFQSLEELSLKSLPNLKGLLKVEVVEMFPNLGELSIDGCPSLILPKLSSLETLHADSCSSVTLASFAKLENVTELCLKIGENMTSFTAPKQTLGNLNSLKNLILKGLSEHSLPPEEEGLRGLKSVTSLSITESETLTYLTKEWMPNLTALEKLFIYNCPEFVEFPEEIKYLQTTLRDLSLQRLPKMTCLPYSLQHLTSLQMLILDGLPQLTLLRDWLGKLTSLAYLAILKCPNIASLPSTVQGMENLKYLTIGGCPELERRCEREKGEDWHKIAHIPHKRIGGDW